MLCFIALWMLPNIALLDNKHIVFVKVLICYPTIHQKREGFDFKSVLCQCLRDCKAAV